jgi:addiction module RelE/StbE family toxin
MRSLVISKSTERKIKIFIRKHPTIRSKLEQVVTNLLQDPFLASLETHRLSGRLKHLYSASISYDYRVVFFFDDKSLYLVNIGSHEEVY